MKQAVRRIVIVGGGTAGWMTAALTGQDLARRLTESGWWSRMRSAPSASARRQFRRFQSSTRHSNSMRTNSCARLSGTFKLGIEFVDWGRLGDALHPRLRPHRPGLGRLQVLPVLVAAATARQCCRPEPILDQYGGSTSGEVHAQSPGHEGLAARRLSYAFHFDASLYAAICAATARRAVCVRTEGKIVATTLART